MACSNENDGSLKGVLIIDRKAVVLTQQVNDGIGLDHENIILQEVHGEDEDIKKDESVTSVFQGHDAGKSLEDNEKN